MLPRQRLWGVYFQRLRVCTTYLILAEACTQQLRPKIPVWLLLEVLRLHSVPLVFAMHWW